MSTTVAEHADRWLSRAIYNQPMRVFFNGNDTLCGAVRLELARRSREVRP